MTAEEIAKVAEAVAAVMRGIREDVDAGRGPNIEADAVLLGFSDEFCQRFPEVDRRNFETACDLDDLIPGEAFHGIGF